MHTEQEQWLPVVGYEGLYEVSDRGRVRRGGRIRSLNGSKVGYLILRLSKDGQQKTHAVHVLVARAFLGERPPAADVCHNDGSRTNNLLTNLRYGSRAENTADARRHGTQIRGERAHCSKLTRSDVRELRASFAAGARADDLAEKFGISKSTVYYIARRDTWTWLN